MGLFNLFGKPNKSKKINMPVKNPYADNYYKGMEQLECMWSVIKNLDLLKSKEAKTFEKLCFDNKRNFQNMVGFDKRHNKDYITPPHAPCYVRLAMLYEKQEEWKKAIDICAEAIRLGAYDDHSKGKMYGRLARMLKKAGIKPTKEIAMFIKG